MIKVSDVMVPLSEYATVNEASTLYEAVLALEMANTCFKDNPARHRAVLVLDGQANVVGKLSQLDVLKGLEPKYNQVKLESLSGRWGFAKEYIHSMIEDYGLWKNALDNLCRKASEILVRDIMYTPQQGEYVKAEDTLNEAIHHLIIGRHQSLLVTRQDRVVGVLRLNDVFARVCDMIKTCRVDSSDSK